MILSDFGREIVFSDKVIVNGYKKGCTLKPGCLGSVLSSADNSVHDLE